METNKAKRDLIKQHLEGWAVDDLRRSSIDYYAKTGMLSGSLYLEIEKLMEEWARICVNVNASIKRPTFDNEEVSFVLNQLESNQMFKKQFPHSWSYINKFLERSLNPSPSNS